jgi:hypothetical protein
MLQYRQFPTDLFTGRPSSIEELRAMILGEFSTP